MKDWKIINFQGQLGSTTTTNTLSYVTQCNMILSFPVDMIILNVSYRVVLNVAIEIMIPWAHTDIKYISYKYC